jgi:hypothetical protein
MSALWVSALLLLMTTWIAVPGARSDDEFVECETPERLEILNDVLEGVLLELGIEPFAGCDSGPWRTFGDEDWPFSDTHVDFIMAVATAVPEPRGPASAPFAIAALALLGCVGRKSRRGAPR